MTKRVGVLLAVGAIAVVILIFIVTPMRTVLPYRHSSPDSGRVEINAADRARMFLGLSSDLDLLDARPRWFSDGVIRITPTLGVNFGFLRPLASTFGFARSVKVCVDGTPSDGETDFAANHHRSYETGIRVYFSPSLHVGVTYGKRYEEDSVTTILETEVRL